MAQQITDSLSMTGSLTRNADVDSLLRDASADSLRLYAADPYADSLQWSAWDSLGQTANGEWFTWDSLGQAAGGIKMSAADVVYGPFSTLADHGSMTQMIAADAATLTGNTFYNIAVLICFIAICLIFYVYRGYSSGVFNVLRGRVATEKMVGEQDKVFGAFLSRTIAIGLLVTGLTILKFIDLLLTDRIPALSEWESLALIPVIWAVMSLIWGFRMIFLRIAGKLTSSRGFTTRLCFLKKITFALWTILITPLFLLYALSDGQSAYVIGTVIVTVTLLIWTLLLIRTFMLFIRYNFSILLWILYLCAVEIFPVSFAVMAAGKLLV